jgi:DNA-nicking Smr family endonuclease
MNLSKNNTSKNDSFRDAVGAVRALKADDRYREPLARPGSLPGKPARIRIPEQSTDPESPVEAVQALVADASLGSRALLRNGLPRSLLRRMGSRECPVVDSFDLHGMTEKTARQALLQFLSESIQNQFECVRIVHGKGLRSGGPPVLKLMSWQLLWRHPLVLAIKPCGTADGGTGAVQVLLKINRNVR